MNLEPPLRDAYWCAGQIRASLRTITDNYADALDTVRPKDDSDKRPAKGEAPSPVNEHILDVRAETHLDLAYYARFILNEVNDGTIQTKVDATDIDALAKFIDTWALALAEQARDDADQCRIDLSKNANHLASIVNGDITRRIQVGPCPELTWLDDGQAGRCTGNLWAIMRKAEALLPKFIGCDANTEHQWAPHEWVTIGRRIDTLRDEEARSA